LLEWFNRLPVPNNRRKILRDNPSKGDIHDRPAVTPNLLSLVLRDYDMSPIYLLGLMRTLLATPTTKYLALIFRSQDFGTFTSNLPIIPVYTLFIIQLLV